MPVFVEGDSPKTVEFLRYVGKLFSDNVREADLEYRLRLHVAAVLACNCVNRLFVHADRILNDLDTDIRIMWPLINETVKKLQTMTPLEAQTGPAARGDRNTVDLHLAILEAKPQTQQIYRIISNDIQDECSRL